jgi:N-acetylglutamate synthase-like GNAT family acetyltransferase
LITLRTFRPEDASGEGEIVAELLRDDEPIIGLTAEIDGEVAAYGGIRQVHGTAWAYFAVVNEEARSPFFLHRTMVIALSAAASAGISPIYTFADTSKPRAEAWLKRLGFRPLQEHEKDPVIKATEASVNHAPWILEGANG